MDWKDIFIWKASYSPEPNTNKKIEVGLDLSNYATRSDLQDATDLVELQFANDFANWNRILKNKISLN